MKRIVVLFLTMAMIFSSLSLSPVSADLMKIFIGGKTYIRTFYDEFGGTELDDTKWSRSAETYRQGDYCKWSHSMSYLDGKGHLVLGCEYADNGDLLCGAVNSKEQFEQRYGYFEASVKLQQVEGFWSAFWLMPKNIDLYGLDGGSDGTEIDVFEAFSAGKKGVNFAVHYDGYGTRHKSKGKSVTADVYDGKYHKFSVLWDENNYIFYIDDKENYRITSKDVDISEVAGYLILSLESSLGWTGKPNAEDMPSGILVDYVKVYQRADYFTLENVAFGDVDQNLEINLADVKKLREYLIKENIFIKEDNADLNCDRKIDIKDYLILRKYIARLITELPYK